MRGGSGDDHIYIGGDHPVLVFDPPPKTVQPPPKKEVDLRRLGTFRCHVVTPTFTQRWCR